MYDCITGALLKKVARFYTGQGNKMKNFTLVLAVSFFAATLPTSVNADMADKLDHYVGYTIVMSKTVKGWISDDGTKSGKDFSGCEYGRKIIFTDDTYVTCSSYGYD